MIFELSKIFEFQAELDKTIFNNHDVNYSNTKERRYLAFLVELGELANTTRCFKRWSLKPSDPKDIVLDEFVDGLHFIISIAISFKFSFDKLEVSDFDKDTTLQILETYTNLQYFKDKESIELFEQLLKSFLGIALSLGFDNNDIQNGYQKKLQINYQRQENKY